jgi:hypothetical protein
MQKTSKTRFVSGEHFADILVRYNEGGPPVYYWICQKFGEGEILGLGTTLSFEEAEIAARDCLDQLSESGACDAQPLDPLNFRVN